MRNNDKYQEKWLNIYSYAKDYYEKYGNLLIPRLYTVYGEDGETIRLGLWIISQRQSFKDGKLRQERITLLNDIQMVWNVNMAKWHHNYDFVKKYYEKHHDLMIPQNYEIVGLCGDKINLYSWLQDQKNDYKKGNLLKEQIDLLEHLNIKWRKEYVLSWDDYYELLKEYYNTFGNVNVSSNYTCVAKNGDKVKLDGFVYRQRKSYELGVLSEKRISLLNDIHMVWDINDAKIISNIWKKNYYFADEYYKKHGHLLVDWKYIVNDDNYGVIKLGQWIVKQRQAYKNNKLIPEQVKLLNKIGMVWVVNQNEDEWMKYYDALKRYKDIYGDLYVNEEYTYKDDNGNIYDLYTWLNDQRNLLPYKDGEVSNKRYSLLYNLRISWDKNLNLNILEKYIEDEYNKYINDELNDKKVIKLIESGVFTYSDYDGIQKSSASYFMSKIKKRK